MNYIGSKKTLLPFLEEVIYQIVPSKAFTLIDLFAGTGAVGQHFKKNGHTIIANDLQYYSYVLNKNYIENSHTLTFKKLEKQLPTLQRVHEAKRAEWVCNYLDTLEGEEGFIYQNYCLGGTQGKEFERQYFSDENGKKVDTLRKQIENWKNTQAINAQEYYFLLTTLLENIDKVANTASVYGAFLKHLKKSAQKPFLMAPAYFEYSTQPHQVFNQPAEQLIHQVKAEVLYLDPPYNHRQYAPNYHLLETIARFDAPTLKGKTGLRDYSNQISQFAQKKAVKAAFEYLISHAQAQYIFLSYNNEGLLSLEDIKQIMSKRGKYGFITKNYQRFKADRDENRQHIANSVEEYLHYVVID